MRQRDGIFEDASKTIAAAHQFLVIMDLGASSASVFNFAQTPNACVV
jgi:hypothetical protein